jgi:hypothetical protein
MDEVSWQIVHFLSILVDPIPVSINIFIWSVALLSHAACSSFGGLFAVRFILGA